MREVWSSDTLGYGLVVGGDLHGQLVLFRDGLDKVVYHVMRCGFNCCIFLGRGGCVGACTDRSSFLDGASVSVAAFLKCEETF